MNTKQLKQIMSKINKLKANMDKEGIGQDTWYDLSLAIDDLNKLVDEEIKPFILPMAGSITKAFGVPDDYLMTHNGIDIFDHPTYKTVIFAAGDGEVYGIWENRFEGLCVNIRHPNNLITRYCHCSSALVSEGDVVKKGEKVAVVGNTGEADVKHLHFEVLKNGKFVDPMDYIE